MPELKAFTAAILASGALLAAAAFAQGSDRWTMGVPMPSARTEVAVAELGGKIYVVGGFGGERESRNLRSKRRPLEPRRRNSARVASCGGGGLAKQVLRRRRFRRALDANRRGARIRPGE